MDWTFIFIGLALAVFMGAALASLLYTICPEWSARRKRLTAAAFLPAVTAAATLVGLLIISTADHGQGENMEDLAVAAVLTIGGGFTLLAWIGGLLGATLTTRRRG